LREDWALIEASLAKQYGIRIRHEADMPWTEFYTLVSGLMPDTPLGNMVSIRAEKDPEALKAFNSEQNRIHREWQIKQAKKKTEEPESLEKEMDNLGKVLKKAFA